MLTRFVRAQLVVFAIASIIGVTVMVFAYMQVPTLLGLGRITVKLELPSAGGLYRFANVTYRGVQVGKVTEMNVSRAHAEATLSLGTTPRIPADLVAEVRSVSAIGEQYVELLPRTEAAPYLHDGSVIQARDTKIPQPVGPMLDQVSTLIKSIPKDKLSGLIDESFRGLDGAGFDLGSLFDSSATLSRDLNRTAERSTALIEDSGPLLDSQAQSSDALKLWARSLAGITTQAVDNDPQIRTLLQKGPAAADEVSRLFDQIKPTLPILLANMTTFGQIAVTYRPSLEQVLVLLPPFVGFLQASSGMNNPTGQAIGDFRISIGDPNPCTVGFLPPSQWRSPADTTTIDTPDGLYCKLPQDSPILARGARNYPCMGVPGKRAPTVQICDSDKPYQPLAMRQHALGPNPIDPNLIAQGVPPDDRVTAPDNLYAPIEGTPTPQGAPPSPAIDPPSGVPAPSPVPLPPGIGPVPGSPGAPADGMQPPLLGGIFATPSSFTDDGAGVAPSIAVAHYNPQTGQYATADGRVARQTDLIAPAHTWQDLVYRAKP